MNCNKKTNKKYSLKLSTKFVIKTLLTVVITLVILILIKSNKTFKTNFYKYVYEKNFSFSKVNELYKKYVGNNLPFKDIVNQTDTVFKETLVYSKKEKYKDGVKLNVSENYLVPIQESGIVVYIGAKDDYNDTVIIQQKNGIDMWYGNINNVNVKLYDYVEKGAVLGDCNSFLYLVYKKDGNVLNYEDYI